MSKLRGQRRTTRGQSLIEVTLLLPWFLFLFVGVFDWGFYSHALISIESAVRVAGLYGASASGGAVSSATVCALTLDELKVVSNVNGLSTCTGTLSPSQPVIVTITCPAPSAALDNLNSVQIQVQYQTLTLIPIPGLLARQANLSRTVQLPMKGNATCSVI
jgi:Flp pilus assembly protein TadG